MRYTIAQKRELAVIELARRKAENPTDEDIQAARKTMNSFYKLCGLDETLLYRNNDKKTYNSRYTRELEEKSERWVKRLNEYLKPFKAEIKYFGYLPTICNINTTQDLYLAHFYN